MIEVETKGRLRVIAINRPDKANALTQEMLEDILSAVEASKDAGAVILTGRGKVFSAGADLEAAQAGLATSPIWETVSDAIRRLPCLTIAALNGTLAGGAFGMALACDMRVARPGAHFFYPVMSLGFLPQPSDPRRLVRVVGPARAKLILMAGAKISADDALGFGLVDRLSNDPLAEAEALCAGALSASPEHANAIKRMIDTN